MIVKNDYDILLLDFYRRGKLHSISCVCSMTFHTDLEYWGIDKLLLDACCAIRHYPEMEIRRREYEASKKHLDREERRTIGTNFGDSTFARYRTMVWNSMEYPESSIPARVGKRYYKRFYKCKIYYVYT